MAAAIAIESNIKTEGSELDSETNQSTIMATKSEAGEPSPKETLVTEAVSKSDYVGDTSESKGNENEKSKPKENKEEAEIKTEASESNTNESIKCENVKLEVEAEQKNKKTDLKSSVKEEPVDKKDKELKSNGHKAFPQKKIPQELNTPKEEDRLKEMRKVNELIKEELDIANETITDYSKNIRSLEHRVKKLEQENKKLRSNEKSAKKAEAEMEDITRLAQLKKDRAAEMEKNLTMMRENQEELMQENMQLRDKMESLKKKYAATGSDLSALKQRITELEDKIDALTKKNRQLNDANDEYRSFVQDLKTRNSLQEQKIERLKNQTDKGSKRSGSDREDSREPSSKSKRSSSLLDKDDRHVSDSSKSKRSSSVLDKDERHASSKSKRHRSESRSAAEDYGRQEKSHGSDSRQLTSLDVGSHNDKDERDEGNIAKIGLIGDANAKYIIPILNSISKKIWTAITGMQTIDDLEEEVESKSIILDKVIQNDQIIVMLGTNNIRRGEDGERIGSRLYDVVKKITWATATQVKIAEIPPTKIGHTEKTIAEVMKANERIKKDPKHSVKLKRLEPFTLKEILRSDGNGYHITDEAATAIAKDFDEQTMDNDVASERKKTIVEMEYGKVGMVVGRQGIVRQSLQDKYLVKIVCDRERVIIRGEAENRRRCYDEIKQIVSKYVASSTSTSEMAASKDVYYDYNPADYRDYNYDKSNDYGQSYW